MARAVYPHEITDPDFQWLLNNYCESHPGAFKLDMGSLPVVILAGNETAAIPEAVFQPDEPLALPPDPKADIDSSSPKK